MKLSDEEFYDFVMGSKEFQATALEKLRNMEATAKALPCQTHADDLQAHKSDTETAHGKTVERGLTTRFLAYMGAAVSAGVAFFETWRHLKHP